MKGPFYRTKKVYALAFTDTAQPYATDANGQIVYDEYGEPTPSAAPGTFTIECHLEGASEADAKRVGLDTARFAVKVTAANPKEGDPRIKHGSVATVSPIFPGLGGTITIQGGPDSRLKPVVKALGVEYVGVFSEG